MKTSLRIMTAVLLAALFCTVQKADATIRIFQFNGTSIAFDGSPSGVLMRATVVYDDASSPKATGSGYAFYNYISFQIAAGGNTYVAGAGTITVANSSDNGSQFQVNASNGLLQLSLATTSEVFSSTDLPTSLTLSDFDASDSYFGVTNISGGDYLYYAPFTSINQIFPVSTSTTITSSKNPSFTDSSVTFTATVTSDATVNEGTVSFTSNGSAIPGGGAVAVSNGVASLTTSFTNEGSFNVVADYVGNIDFATSSDSLTQTANNHTTVNGNVFCNSASGISSAVAGTTNPYPSELFVSGLSGTINSMTVTIDSLKSTKPSAMELLLVGPGNQTFMLMNDVGGAGDNIYNMGDFIFSDAGATFPNVVTTTGTYTVKPTAVNTGSLLPPAPGGPYNLPAPGGSATLASVFSGINPNGTWQLYMQDFVTGGAPTTIGGWCLNFTLNSTVPTASVLSLTGNSPICKGGSSSIGVAITGGTSPYTVVYQDNNNNLDTIYNYVSSSAIAVSPNATTTYSLVSVTDANSLAGTGNSGTATVTVNQPYTSAVVSDTFKVAGSYPINIPAGVTSLTLQLWAGGGGGGGGNSGWTTSGAGGAGGSFTYSVVPVTPLSTYSVVVGAGGQAGKGSGNGTNGDNGDSSAISIGNNVLAFAVPGLGGHAGINGSASGAPLTTGITYNGGPGGNGENAIGSTGGAGGGAAGNSGSGSAGANAANGGNGGGGGTGGGGNGGNGGTDYVHAGNGIAPGGGGGGGASTNGPAYDGGNGADGQVVVSYVVPDTSVSACNAFTWYGTIYTASGTASHTFSGGSANGCDSTITLSLTVNQSDTSFSTITSCDSYIWNGDTITSGGNYFYNGFGVGMLTHGSGSGAGKSGNLYNAAGCDSIAILYLTINNSNTGDTVASACNSFTWYGVTYTSTGSTATHVFTNAAGCDSTVTLNLTINNTPAPAVTVSNNCGSSTLSTTATGSLQWSTGATTSAITVTSARTYSVTQTLNGCPSTAGTGASLPKTFPPIPRVTVLNACGSSTLSTTASGSLLWSPGAATTTSITITAAETVSVTTTVSGCTSTSGTGTTLPLPVPAKPPVSVDNDCGHTVLTTSATGTLHWSMGASSKSITVTRGGTYTVTTTVGSCVSLPGSAFANPGNAPEEPDSMRGNNSACRKTGPFTYSVNPLPGANSYVWSLPPGCKAPSLITSAPHIAVTFTDSAQTGKIKVAGKNPCGTGPARSKTITVNCREEEPPQEAVATGANMVAYPNPAHNVLNVDFVNATNSDYNIKMFDITGRLLLNKVATAQQGSNHLEFDLSNFSSGLYILSFTSGEESKQVRVVVE